MKQAASPTALETTRELLLAHPERRVNNLVAVATGLTGMLVVLAVPAAFSSWFVWRILLSLVIGSTLTAWIKVAFESIGRRARIRRAYVAWLETLSAEEALLEVIELHTALLRDKTDPVATRKRLESMLKNVESSDIAQSIERWDRLKEAIRTEANVDVEAMHAQQTRLARMRLEDDAALATYKQSLTKVRGLPGATTPNGEFLVVRRAHPRVGEVGPRALRYEGVGLHPSVPGAVDASTSDITPAESSDADIAHVPRPSLASPLREVTRWAPFAQTSPLAKELLDLFGGDEGLAPDVREELVQEERARREALHRAFHEGYSSVARGVAIESSAAGELVGPKPKPLFTAVVKPTSTVPASPDDGPASRDSDK